MNILGLFRRAASGALLSGLILFACGAAANAQQSANVQFTANDWGGGFDAQIKIINTGTQPINGWTLSFDFDRAINSIYSATIVSHAGNRYTIKNASNNSVIAVGGNVTFGFVGAPGNITNPPANYVLNNLPLGRAASTFSYQGRLSDNGAAANGVYDLQFALYDDATGAQIGEAIQRDDVPVTNGIFTVWLDFGATAFPGANRSLEIRTRRGTRTDDFTVLTPRQIVASVPYAVHALSAGQLMLTSGAPVAADCNEASEYGRTRVDASAGKLWVCTAAGWKSTTLQ